jgi:hypothetical protein
MNSWQKGSFQEKRVKKIIESGGYDGQEYACQVAQKSKFFAQDYFAHDIICVNANNWLLCQVKYTSAGKPPKRKKVIAAMLEHPMPPTTKRVLARVNGKTEEITYDEL